MRIAGIDYNDFLNGEGVCISVWFQGCPHRCYQCHNPETWDFNGGQEIEYLDLEKRILENINKNGIVRNLSLLGGEPLCDENIKYAISLAAAAKQKYPNISIYCWTGSTYEELIKKYGEDIFKNIDVLIDGPFDYTKRDITLKLRGSTNQRILILNKKNSII